MPSTGGEQQAHKKPQSEAASPLNAARDYSGDSVGGEMRSVIPSPPRSFGSSRTLSPLLLGTPGVPNQLGRGEENNGAPSKGMTHVSSAPVLSGGVPGGQSPPTDKKEPGQNAGEGMDKTEPEAAAGPKKGAARGEAEQPPKSGSGQDKKGKAANSPSSVGKKPGMWAKMMARWLHPDAKVRDSSGALGANVFVHMVGEPIGSCFELTRCLEDCIQMTHASLLPLRLPRI